MGREGLGITDAEASSRGGELALEGKSGVLPVEQPARVAPHVAIAAPDKVAVEGDARETVDIRAVDDDLIVRPYRRIKLVGTVEVDRAWDVLGLERPAIEGHDQLELLATVELPLELFAADGPNGLGAQGCVLARLVHGGNHRAVADARWPSSSSRAIAAARRSRSLRCRSRGSIRRCPRRSLASNVPDPRIVPIPNGVTDPVPFRSRKTWR